MSFYFFFFQAEDGIRDRSPSRGLGDVYKRQYYLRKVGVTLESGMHLNYLCFRIKKCNGNEYR